MDDRTVEITATLPHYCATVLQAEHVRAPSGLTSWNSLLDRVRDPTQSSNSFGTVIHNSSFVFNRSWRGCPNELVKTLLYYMSKLVHLYFLCVYVFLSVSVCPCLLYAVYGP